MGSKCIISHTVSYRKGGPETEVAKPILLSLIKSWVDEVCLSLTAGN
jgi:hypothetical protein